MLKNPTDRKGPWSLVMIMRNLEIRLPMNVQDATAWADRLFPNREQKKIYVTDCAINPQDYQTMSQILLGAIRAAHISYTLRLNEAYQNMRRVDNVHTMDKIHGYTRNHLENCRRLVRQHCAEAREYYDIIQVLTSEWQSIQPMLVDDVAAIENWANTYLVEE